MTSATEQADPRYQLDAATRTIQLLQAVGEHGPIGLAALTAKLGWTKPMVYRLVRTLHSCEALTLRGDRYSLGPVVIGLGYAALQSISLVDSARKTLTALHEATGESTVLTVLDKTDVVYVDFRETDHLLVIRARLGSRLPAFCTSSGQVLLSGFTNAELEQLFAGYDFEPPTPHSVASLGELIRRVEEVRALGYALVNQEVAEGHRSSAAPVHDHTGHVAASISISVPATRVSMDQLRSLTKQVLLPQTRALSYMLGYQTVRSKPTG